MKTTNTITLSCNNCAGPLLEKKDSGNKHAGTTHSITVNLIRLRLKPLAQLKKMFFLI
jgi:hypothetical protein